ncbi:MAG: sulfatase-like hydrolase/transferase [Chitinivibrionales bacterium]|nr:sulfatase-like hydrolase/transferase [Chitinivibrionales bacterium]
MNTIHIIMDTLRRDHLGCYGNNWIKTPNLDAFASRSVVFDRCYTGSFPCMPARRDFVTGNFEFPFRGWGPLEESDTPLAEQLGAHGVTTGLVTDHYHLFREGAGNYHWQYDCWHFIRGMEGDKVYTDPAHELDIIYNCDPRRIAGSTREYYYRFKHFNMKREEDWPAARTFMQAFDWIFRNRGHQNDIHLQIDCFPPHEPFDPPPGYAELYDPEYQGDRLTVPSYRKWAEEYSERELRNIRALYAGNVSYVDKWFGYFIDSIERLGMLDTTMIIVSTDHGTYLGDHGWTGKLFTYMYDCVAHIPMMVYHPHIPHRRESALVQNVDVAPTILAASNITDGPAMHGANLLPMLDQTESLARNAAHSGMFGITHVVNDGRHALHLHHNQSRDLYWQGKEPSYFAFKWDLGAVEAGPRRKVLRSEQAYYHPPALFDLHDDPQQEVNLYGSEPDRVEAMQNELCRFCSEIQAPPEYLSRLLSEPTGERS